MLKNAFNIETRDAKFERCETLKFSKGKEELRLQIFRDLLKHTIHAPP